jgi:hypothetical protein
MNKSLLKNSSASCCRKVWRTDFSYFSGSFAWILTSWNWLPFSSSSLSDCALAALQRKESTSVVVFLADSHCKLSKLATVELRRGDTIVRSIEECWNTSDSLLTAERRSFNGTTEVSIVCNPSAVGSTCCFKATKTAAKERRSVAIVALCDSHLVSTAFTILQFRTLHYGLDVS